MSKASNYRRRHHQPSGDVGSTFILSFGNDPDFKFRVYGYLKGTMENPLPLYLSTSSLLRMANQAIQDGDSFQKFRNDIGFYIDKPNFKWMKKKDSNMEAHFYRDMKTIERNWPKHLK